jgi:hypothetical protein
VGNKDCEEVGKELGIQEGVLNNETSTTMEELIPNIDAHCNEDLGAIFNGSL